MQNHRYRVQEISWDRYLTTAGKRMDTGLRSRTAECLILVLVMAVVAGCSRPAPELRLEQAGRALAGVANDLSSLNTEIGQLEERLAEHRQQRKKLLEEKFTLEERLERRATDVALFRSVQSKLLASDELRDSAISVEADDRAIVLAGTVSSETQRNQAIAIANAVPGVSDVRSRMHIETPQG